MSKIVFLYSTGKISWRFKQINFFFRQKEKKQNSKTKSLFPLQNTRNLFIIIIILFFIFFSFAIPKYNNYSYYHKAYIHAQTDYTPKHSCNSTTTTQGMPTVILKVLFKKEETNHFCRRRKVTRLQSPFVQ